MLQALLKAASVITGRRMRRPVDPELSVLGLRTGQRPLPRRLQQRRVPSMFSSMVRDRFGNLKHLGLPHPNLRTNAGLDWQAALLADYRKTSSGNFNATTGTTASVSGTPWTVDQWIGHIVYAPNTSITSVDDIIYGIIQSNTSSVLTIDRWYKPSSPGGAVANTLPASNAYFAIAPGGAPHWFIGLSTDGTAPAATDTILASEITTGGLARALPTSFTHTASVASYSISKTFTASATFTVNKGAVFTSVVKDKGFMPFESAEPNPPTVISGDTLQQVITVTF